MELQEAISYLKEYRGRPLTFMEVCGTHTAAIFKGGLRSFLPPSIRLVSGPGCPVCVTPAAYVDKCVEYAMTEGCVLLSFGDMLKVPGSRMSLAQARGRGGRVELMYSPMEAVEKAAAHPETSYVLAAVGFETTAPVFALAVEAARERGIQNLRLVTALKTVFPALEWVCREEKGIDGFLCPGHVSVVTGVEPYRKLAIDYKKPCAIAGFEPEHLLAAILDLVRQSEEGSFQVRNYYKNAVKERGNRRALELTERCFEKGPAVWRGLGEIADSGFYLKGEVSGYDGGSRELREDMALPAGCRCGDVIVGRADPAECPFFGKPCTPQDPYGPCMVSPEGACGVWYRNRR
ncbi:MAG: hydrogenase formation protein HypD [Bacillota bacterium]|nr:hydrogenase formation protein HypD [Bacillota bacterium]